MSETSPRTELHWTVLPAARRPMQAVLVALVVVAATLLAVQLSGMPLLGAVGGVMLLTSVRAFFLPRRYHLDADGAREDGPLCRASSMSWDEVRRITATADGVHLSARLTDSRLLPDRGLFLRSSGNRDEIVAFARAHRSEPPSA